MTPLCETVTELRIVVDATAVRARRVAHPSWGDLQDLRTEALAELCDAMDRIDCGLGTRLQFLLYPRLDGLALGAETGRKGDAERRK